MVNFLAKKIFNNKEVKLRFIWRKISEDTAKWEQAYYDEIKNEWETNWTMLFTSIE